MGDELRVLLIEDSDDDAALILRALRKGGYNPVHTRVESGEALQSALNEREWDLILSDYSMPGFNGLEALRMVKEHGSGQPFILVSGAVGEETATLMMREGARDYVMKDKLARLVPAIQRELAETRERRARQTREKMLQAQLNQSQKMEAIGTLAGGVAHDFNNILTVIRGYTELALRQLQPEQPGYSELQGIREAAQRSSELTHQLLTFARKEKVSPQVVDLNRTVEGILGMLKRLIGERLDFKWLPGRRLWPVKIDPRQMDQILANLCVNARDAIDGEGRIAIETHNMVLDANYCAGHNGFVPGEYVLLSVSDNGSGMSPETSEHIFEPFFTTKEVGKGTGLGLATVYGIIKQNQGFVNYYSELGQGTTFRIYLPRQHGEAEVPDDEHRVQALSKGGSETILVVEDEEAILNVTTRALQELGYQVLTASTPGRALELARDDSLRMDLILSDVVMPEMNGRELVGKIEELRPGIPCLFMSGYTSDAISHGNMLPPNIHFLQKPFSLERLAAKVRESLDGPLD